MLGKEEKGNTMEKKIDYSKLNEDIFNNLKVIFIDTMTEEDKKLFGTMIDIKKKEITNERF